MKTSLLLIYFISGIHLLTYSNPDTLNVFRIEELTYHSEFEEEAFTCFKFDTECEPFQLALASDPLITTLEYDSYRQEFYRFLDGLRQNNKFNRKPQTQIDFIFKAIHDKHFILYKNAPLFSQIFINGDFNCLTASVLYALAFEYLDIPYKIMMVTDHVFLLAYPGELSIIVEATNPVSSTSFAINNREKAKAVQSLVDMKIISRQEVEQKGVEQVFNEFYLAEETPELLQLIGGLYSNYAATEIANLRFIQAHELFKKSSFLYPRRATTNSLIINADAILTRSELENKKTYVVLSDMEKFMSLGISRQLLIDQGLSFLHQLQTRGQQHLIDSAYIWMYSNFSDSIIKAELKFVYHFNKSMWLLMNQRDSEAIDFLETAYLLKPDNDNVNVALMQFLYQKLQLNRSTQENYNTINEFAERYQTLSGSKHFQRLHQLSMLEIINQQFIFGNFEAAEKARKEFENKFPPTLIQFGEVLNFLEEVYSRASLFYYQSKRISRAREILTSGLNYSPDNYELKSKLQQL